MVKKFTVEIDITPELREKVETAANDAMERAITKILHPCDVCKMRDRLNDVIEAMDEFGEGYGPIDDYLVQVYNAAESAYNLLDHDCWHKSDAERPKPK